MTRVVVRPAAAADIEDAYQWYESQRTGLGEEFLAAGDEAIRRALSGDSEAFLRANRQKGGE